MSSVPARPRARTLPFAAALLVAALGVTAQAQDPEAPAEPFAERVEVEVVNVDVIVTGRGGRSGRSDRSDRDGGRVLDLKQDDFELFVDGRPVPIEYFAAPRLPAVAALAAESIAPLPVAPTLLPEPIPPTNLILYIDQTALDNRARHETLRELREFFVTRGEGGDSVTVAVFEQNLRVLLLPTTDRARIGQALEELERRPSLARLGNGERMQLQHDIRNYGRDAARFPPRFRLAEAQRLEHEIVRWAEQQIDRQRRSIAALAKMVDALAAAEGRKVVVLATAGIQAHPAVALLAALDQQRGVATSSDANRAPTLEGQGLALLTDFERMIQAAQNARIAFYTVAPGAEAPVENSAEFGSAGPNADRPLPRDFGALEASSSIARMAGATGGASFTLGSDLDRRLEGVTADVGASYSLGFTTGAEAGDKDHRIEVRTRRAGLEVRHRESFRRRSAPDRAAAALAAAVTFGQAENPLEITLQLGAGKPNGKGEIVSLAVGMPLHLLTLIPEGEVRRGRVSVRVAIQDARGRLLESAAALVPIVVPENQMKLALASSWYHRAEMRLAPGPQRVAVVVLDEISGVQSTAFVELEIPEAN